MEKKEITIELKNVEIVVTLCVLSVFLIFELLTMFKSPIVFGDEGTYAATAREMARRVEFFPWNPVFGMKGEKSGMGGPPFTFLIIAFSFMTTGLSEVMVKFLYPFSAFVTGIAVYFLGRLIYNKKVGLFAAIIAMALPSFVTYSVLVYKDVFVTLFTVMFFIFFILSMERKNVMYWIVCGIFGALAFLSKVSGLNSFIVLFLAFGYEIVTKKKVSLTLLKKYGIILITSFLIVFPLLLRNFYYYKTPMCAFPYIEKFFDTSGCSIKPDVEKKFKFEGRTEEVGTEMNVFKMGLTNYFKFAYGNLFLSVLGFFCGLFLILTKKSKNEIYMLFMLFVFLLVFAYSSRGRAEDTARYTLAWSPIIAVIAGRWFSELYDYIHRHFKHLAVLIVLFVIIVSFLNLHEKLKIMETVKRFSPSFFEACQWVKENLPKDVIISTVWSPRAAYACDRRMTGHVPDIFLSMNATYSVEYAKKVGVTHLFVQKFSMSNRKLAERYSIDELRFLENNPKYFIKVFENGPSLEECIRAGGCDGNIIYEINYSAVE